MININKMAKEHLSHNENYIMYNAATLTKDTLIS